MNSVLLALSFTILAAAQTSHAQTPSQDLLKGSIQPQKPVKTVGQVVREENESKPNRTIIIAPPSGARNDYYHLFSRFDGYDSWQFFKTEVYDSMAQVPAKFSKYFVKRSDCAIWLVSEIYSDYFCYDDLVNQNNSELHMDTRLLPGMPNNAYLELIAGTAKFIQKMDP